MTNTYVQAAAVLVAVSIAFWPQIKDALTALAARVPTTGPVLLSETKVHPTYAEVMSDLQSVRLRLVRTGCLNDDQRAAIDVLTLALVDGSDK